jgi:hypothetical protein
MLEIWAMFQKTAERSGALALRLGLPAGIDEPEGEVMDGLKKEGEKLELEMEKLKMRLKRERNQGLQSRQRAFRLINRKDAVK